MAEAAVKNRVTYEAVIGLEVHVQLQTRSKTFCGCSTRFGDPPSTNICPVCLGLPGALPVLNKQAVELGVRAALALNLQVRERSVFSRKNYFYPDLPKGYQISQYDKPLAEHGWLEIEVPEPGNQKKSYSKKIGITRLHIEEDAGKSLHDGFPESDSKTYLDFNRCGTPLAEIVSDPDMRSPEEAYAYLTTLKQILEYAEVSDCDMEKGSLRCDANVSLRPKGTEEFGVKTEVKNLNSFRYLARALEYEIGRQTEVLEQGGRVAQETRLWNQTESRTEPMRSKESAHDYRYFPEPDLLPLIVGSEWRERIAGEMPELPSAKKERFIEQFGITPYDAEVLTASRALADYFEAAAADTSNAKATANWIQGELLGALKESGKEIADSPVPPERLAELVSLVEDGTISGKMGKAVFEKMFTDGRPPKEIVEAEGMQQITDAETIEKLCREAVEANPEKAEQFRQGKTSLLGLFVGQVMKASKGQANPKLVNETLLKFLG